MQQVNQQQTQQEQRDLRKFTKEMGLETIQKSTNQVKKSSALQRQDQIPSDKKAQQLSEQMSSAIAQQQLETQIRGYIQTMVEPILQLAKQNIDHNSKKNERFIEMTSKFEGANRQIEDLHREVLQLKTLPKQLSQLESYASNNLSTIKGQLESQDAVIRRLQNKIVETETIREDLRIALEIREAKIESLSNQFSELQERVALECSAQVKNTNSQVKILQDQLNDEHSQRQALQTVVSQVKSLTEENEQSHLVVEYKIQRLQEQIDQLKVYGLDALNTRLDENLDKVLQNHRAINDQVVQVRVLNEQNFYLSQQLAETKEFVAQTLPLLNYMQISDTVRQFLCLSDQFRLIEFDTKKLSQLLSSEITYESLKNYCLETATQCIELRKGLGPFELGNNLDEQYLQKRYDLLQSHYSLYAKLQKEPSQFHIGCMNGTVLKEVRVIYKEKRIVQQKRRTRDFETTFDQRESNDNTVFESESTHKNSQTIQEEAKKDPYSKKETLISRRQSAFDRKQSEAVSDKLKHSRQISSSSTAQVEESSNKVIASSNKVISSSNENKLLSQQSKHDPEHTEQVNKLAMRRKSKLDVVAKPPQLSEEPSIKSGIERVGANAKGMMFNKVMTEAINLNANLIKEHSQKLLDFEARLSTLQTQYEQSFEKRDFLDKVLSDASDTKKKLQKQYSDFNDLISAFKSKQEQQQKHANEVLVHFQLAQTKNFTEFKQSIETEYLEFFKSRQRIRTEWLKQCQEVKGQIEVFMKLIQTTSDQVSKLTENDQIISNQVLDLTSFVQTLQNQARESRDSRVKGSQQVQNSSNQLIEKMKMKFEGMFTCEKSRQDLNQLTDEKMKSTERFQQLEKAVSVTSEKKLGVQDIFTLLSSKKKDQVKTLLTKNLPYIENTKKSTEKRLAKLNEADPYRQRNGSSSICDLPTVLGESFVRPKTACGQNYNRSSSVSLSVVRSIVIKP